MNSISVCYAVTSRIEVNPLITPFFAITQFCFRFAFEFRFGIIISVFIHSRVFPSWSNQTEEFRKKWENIYAETLIRPIQVIFKANYSSVNWLLIGNEISWSKPLFSIVIACVSRSIAVLHLLTNWHAPLLRSHRDRIKSHELQTIDCTVDTVLNSAVKEAANCGINRFKSNRWDERWL